MEENKTITKADEVRAFIASMSLLLESGGFLLHSVHFKRNDEGKVEDIRLSYEERVTNDNQQ